VDSTLRQAAIFRGADASAVQDLTEGLSPLNVGAGHTFFTERQQGDRLYVIISGKGKVGRRSPDGHESFFTMRGAGESFGEERGSPGTPR
jgi:CRP/FNR family transcriptional regulator, cyclic AMP receptor protein